MPKILSVVFFLLLGLHLAVLIEYLPEFLLAPSKLALVTSLLVGALTARAHREKGGLALVIALGLSLAGDLLLLSDEEMRFGLGLGAFLLAHAAFVVCFRQARDDNHEIPFGKKYLLITLGLIVFGIFIFLSLYEGLGSLLVPVAIYILAIITMTIMAVNRINKASVASASWVLTGAVMFMLSDYILARNKFSHPIDMAPVWIMLSYGMAQFSITWGILLYLKES